MTKSLQPDDKSNIQNLLTWLSRLGIFAIVILVYYWAFQGLKINQAIVEDSWKYVITFIKDFWPPNFEIIDIAVKALIETIQMSIWGTTIGAIISLPIAILSARNYNG